MEFRKARVTREHEIEHTTPLEVSTGDRVQIGREDDEYPGWKWCTSADGRSGWVPVELLSSEGVILEDYCSRELAVAPGEDVTIEDAKGGWVRVRNSRGEQGWIPEANVEAFEE